MNKFILSAVMCVAGMSQCYSIQFAVDGIGYVTNSDDPTTVYIAGRQGTNIPPVLEFPNPVEYEGVSYRVTHMKAGAFTNAKTVRDVDMSALDIDIIPDNAFSQCSNLTSVKLPESELDGIGDKAFYGCAKLASVVIPATVTSVGSSAFEGCALSRVTLEGADAEMAAGDRAFLCPGTVTDVVTYRTTPPAFATNDAQGFSTESYRHGLLDVRVDGDATVYNNVKSQYENANVWRNFYIDNPTAIDAVADDVVSSVRIEGHDIVAPAGTQVHTLSGMEVSPRNIQPGIYVVSVPSEKPVRLLIR